LIKDLKNSKAKIVVIGDLMIDHYLFGKCNRISPEAPVQVVDLEDETSVLGGAGNVINNLLAFGCDVEVISVVGDDLVASELKDMLLDSNVNIDKLVTQKNRKTSKKSRVISVNQQIMRFDKESKDDISKDSQNQILKSLEKIIHDIDIVLLSDYGKGVLTNCLTKDIIAISNKNNKRVLVDPKGSDYSKYKDAYLLTPNKKEAQIATNNIIKDEKSLLSSIKQLKDDLNLDYSLITLSEDGIAIFNNKLNTIPTKAKEVYDVTGAGDTVLASIGFCLANGFDIYKSCEFANYAAGVVVGKIGSATTTLDEVEEYISSLHKSSSDTFIKSFEEIEIISKRLKSQNKKVVFTNGCFDILHVGHVKYLQEAKSFGDVLILGLNSDASVKRLKGEKRPINIQADRAYILASLEVVDYVVIFDEDTPYELIKLVQPHTLVKGGDYKGKDVVGSDIADELKLVDFVDGRSTTKTIKKIECLKD
jgi:D-beta-D-heptose 7-phosphate kinase/D-beta-D-heptose 1-phosphate adenosyltransferase